MSKWTSEEKEILEAFEAGTLETVPLSREEIESYRAAARALTTKAERVNLRMSSADLRSLKVRALQEGMPYQTLMGSVLHKYLTGKLVEA